MKARAQRGPPGRSRRPARGRRRPAASRLFARYVGKRQSPGHCSPPRTEYARPGRCRAMLRDAHDTGRPSHPRSNPRHRRRPLRPPPAGARSRARRPPGDPRRQRRTGAAGHHQGGLRPVDHRQEPARHRWPRGAPPGAREAAQDAGHHGDGLPHPRDAHPRSRAGRVRLRDQALRRARHPRHLRRRHSRRGRRSLRDHPHRRHRRRSRGLRADRQGADPRRARGAGRCHR